MRFLQLMCLSVFFSFLFSCGPRTDVSCAGGECFEATVGAMVSGCGDLALSVRDKDRTNELKFEAPVMLEQAVQNGGTSTNVFNLSDKLATLTWYRATDLNITCDDAVSAAERSADRAKAIKGTATLTVKNVSRLSSMSPEMGRPAFSGEASLTLKNIEFDFAPAHRVISKLTIENIKFGPYLGG